MTQPRGNDKEKNRTLDFTRVLARPVLVLFKQLDNVLVVLTRGWVIDMHSLFVPG
ncbi:MAG: hypothetical protein AAF471_05245 [Myxococcota bacterium]